ncbi:MULTISPECIES: mercuric reductase [Sphingomonadales]|jgi:mercuric ion transport protein|uniref:Mercuric ion transport protein n=2 Tax=Sphingomonadales TaxID=204457 RepID=A0A239K1G2_9SPHN|nr:MULTISPECIES: mercuric reductase [Sphingomonadaceae]MAF59907.1 mercuric reductase [Blastomonas sp.]KAA9011421.1 mercuric reductase [Sphingobium limneticum]KAA9023701.1 mercuric reductase [Sphingobium limneticum]KRB79004.1 mercuric reductase [Sphingomonas sp. Root710]MCW1431956.1 mercuric reductase [Novosphingobium sp. JCM 18896]|tara:strand:- start:76552 stop:76920 length:369 start_codon:yes stop_codon:yes gene_type:complete
MSEPPELRRSLGAEGAAVLTVGGIAAAFAVASCCALPILLTTAGLGAGWLGGIALAASPYRMLLLCLSALFLIGGAIMLWRQQRVAMTCASEGVCTPPAVRAVLFIGLLLGVTLFWLGYSYV